MDKSQITSFSGVDLTEGRPFGPEGDYQYGFCLTDTAQNDTYSDFVIFTIKDGMISIAE